MQNKDIDFGKDLDQEEDEEENNSIISLKVLSKGYKEKIMMAEYSENVKAILQIFNEYTYYNENTSKEEIKK